MGGSVVVVTPPSTEVLTLDELRKHLGLGEGNAEPAPTAVTVALIAPAAAGNVDNGVHRYLATFVTGDGETEAGAISAAVTVADKNVNGKVTVSSIPIGGSAVTARKLYRTIAGGSAYLLLTTIADNSTASYTDNTADSSLGAGAPSTNTTEDSDLTAINIAARAWVENRCNRSLITQTLRYTIDLFPGCDYIELPKPNLLTVTSITYVDENGVTQTLSASDYTVDTAYLPGRVLLNWDKIWPSTRWQRNAVTINYTAGYGPARADIPAPIKAAIKLVAADLYLHREATQPSLNMENTADNLLASYRFWEAA